MLQKMIMGSSDSGGGATAIEGTYNGSTVTFSWDYDAVAYIIVWNWTNGATGRVIAYGEIGSDNIKRGTNTKYWFDSSTWSATAFTVTSTARSFSITHNSGNTFENAYIIPLKNKITLA